MEVIFVVSILGIFSAGIYTTAARVTSKRIEFETIIEAQNIIEDARTKFAWSHTYQTQSGTSFGQVLFDSKIIRNYNSADDSTRNKSGLTMLLYPSDTERKAFIMEIQEVPTALCVAYLSNSWQELLEWSVTVGAGEDWQDIPLPLLGNEAISYCKGSSKKLVKFKIG